MKKPVAVAAVVQWTLSLAWVGLAQGTTLDEKLSSQWRRFEWARGALIEQSGRQGGTIRRESWEAMLAAPAEDALTESDYQELRERQRSRIAESRRKALSESVIDLDRVRATGKTESFCALFPKGGMLHVHTSGTLDRATVHLMLGEVNPLIDPPRLRETLLSPSSKAIFYPHELDFLNDVEAGVSFLALGDADQRRIEGLFFLPPGHHPFTRFEGVFTFMSRLLGSRPEVDPSNLIYTALFERARRQGLTYLELTEGAPVSLTALEVFEKRVEQAQRDFGLTVRFIAAFNRQEEAEKNRDRARKLLELPPSEALVGINLLADETDAPALESGQSIYGTVGAALKGGASQLRMTMHAGEMGDARNPRDAILLGAERLGHGVKLADDAVTLEYASQGHLPVEANLVSNVRLEAVESVAHHPFLDMLRLGLKVSLSTDDEGLLETDINNECVQAIQNTDISYSELKQLAENSLATSFAQPLVRAELLKDWQESTARFEQQWLRQSPRE